MKYTQLDKEGFMFFFPAKSVIIDSEKRHLAKAGPNRQLRRGHGNPGINTIVGKPTLLYPCNQVSSLSLVSERRYTTYLTYLNYS
jgi:hypothetical protein